MRLTFSHGTLLLDQVGPSPWRNMFPGVPWQFDGRSGGWRVDARWYRDLHRLEAAKDAAAPPIEDFVPAWQRVDWPRVQLPSLRPEQRAAVDAWTVNGAGCVVMPTGTGKTEVALSIMAASCVSTLIVAPVRDLMYQWHRRIAAGLGYDAGLLGDGIHRVNPVCVTTYDSAWIHMQKLGNLFELVIFDECHHLPGELRRDAARMCAAPLRLGLTATLHRSDGRHAALDWLIGPVAYELPLSQVRGRTLAEYEVLKIPIHLTSGEQARYDRLSREVRDFMIARRKTSPHFSWQHLCAETALDPAARRALKAYHQKVAIEDRATEKLRILEDLFRLHAGEPCLIFTGTNAMARDVSRRFLIPCLLSHSRKRERAEVLAGLERGEFPALVANQVLDEGVDLPSVKVAIVLGGSSSGRQAQQRLGRVLRKSGNARAVLYEIVCIDTNEANRSRRRRNSEAYSDTRHVRRPP